MSKAPCPRQVSYTTLARLVICLVILFGLGTQETFAGQTQPSPSPTPYGTSNPYPLRTTTVTCVTVRAEPSSETVPSTVTITANPTEPGAVTGYRFATGDGRSEETNQNSFRHEYTVSGTYQISVQLKDSNNRWHTSPTCTTSVTLKPLPVESHKAACSDMLLGISSDTAPATVSAKVSGYDNKGGPQQYRLNFGDSTEHSQQNPEFTHTYTKPGNYVLKGYIQDTQGNWVGGTGKCLATITLPGQPLERQPETGSPTSLLLSGILAGGGAGALELLRRSRKYA